MLKKYTILKIAALLFYGQVSFAVTYSFYNGCSSEPRSRGALPVDIEKVSVGELTIKLLNENKIPYLGTPTGLNSFYDSPVGLDALEAISDTKMRAYGPCFAVNGIIRPESPDKIYLDNQDSEVIWFLGYATYDSGVWKDYCIPSHKLRSKFICGDKK